MGACLKQHGARPEPPEFDFQQVRAEATNDPRNFISRWLDHKRREMFCTSGMDPCACLLGLDGAGKTTILYQLALGQVTIMPHSILALTDAAAVAADCRNDSDYRI